MPSTLSDANRMSVFLTIDVHEIEVAQLALEKASSNPVRTYATQMVDDHSMMLQHNLQLAKRVQPDKPDLAAALEHTHQETMEALRTKSGEDFDRAFVTNQVAMHQQALKLVDDLADSADDLRLQVYFKQTRPDLQFHLASAQRLKRQWVASSNSQMSFYARGGSSGRTWTRRNEVQNQCLSLAWFERDMMDFSVPSNSRDRIRQSIRIATYVA